MKRFRVLAVTGAFAIAALSGSAIASADTPDGPVGPGDGDAFLCPVVGDGVFNADMHNGDNGVSAFGIPSGGSFLPGNNQAGLHANGSAVNPEGPGTSPGPGDPDFTPIWPS